MDIQDLGALGELVAAIATLATLIYLALQIRQSSRSVDAATEDGVTTRFNEINMLIGSDPKLGKILTLGIDSPESLTEEEAIQFSFLWRCYMNQYFSLYHLHKQGVLSPNRWAVYAREAAWWLSTPGGKVWKEENSNMREFWEYLEKIEVESVVSVSMGAVNRDDS